MKIFIFFLTFILFSNVSYSAPLELLKTDSILYPKLKHTEQTKLIYQLLNRYHYKKISFDDSLSVKILGSYIKNLDPNREYFFSSDIEFFNQHKYEMDDYIYNGTLNPIYEIFTIYNERVKTRIEYIFNLLLEEPDFTIDEEFVFDRKESKWFLNQNELNNHWRKKIKYAALNMKVLGKSWEDNQETLNKRYKRFSKTINQFNSEDVFEIFINSFTELYDPHTNYFSPVNADRFEIAMSKSFEGIGARLQLLDIEYTSIFEVMPGGPAYRNGELEKGDKVIGVSQGDEGIFEDIIGWRLDDVVSKIKGPKGSVVRLLVIKRESEFDDYPDTIRLVRDKVNVVDEDVTYDIVPFNSNNKSYNFGVIKIPSFYMNFEDAQKGIVDYKSVTRDVKKCIDALNDKSIDGIIIDLRNNGGGSLQEAIDLTGLFVDSGPVVQIKSANGRIEVEKDFDKNTYYDGPLLVLNNSFTASSSEIFSGALQDYNRGLIVGESTFGKGTVQNLLGLERFFPESNEKFGQLKLTLAKYYRISGGSTQKIGVKPDVEFPNIYDRSIFTENSRENALKWDKIREISYDNKEFISQKLVDHINIKFSKDLVSDSSFINLLSYISKTKENRIKSSVTLNYDKRMIEKKESGSSNNSLNTSLKITEIFPIQEESLLKKIKNDLYLRESLKLFAEMLGFTES